MQGDAVEDCLGAAEVEGAFAEVSIARSNQVVRTPWTPTVVADRLVEAADVLARLPEERVRGVYDLWPRIVVKPSGCTRPAAAAPEAIDRLDEALGWLCWLEPEERRLVWLRAEGLPWKWITRRLGVGRTTAWQRWTIALLKIATQLNAAAEQDRPNIKPLNERGSSAVGSV
jgi:hypothetical protein